MLNVHYDFENKMLVHTRRMSYQKVEALEKITKNKSFQSAVSTLHYLSRIGPEQYLFQKMTGLDYYYMGMTYYRPFQYEKSYSVSTKYSFDYAGGSTFYLRDKKDNRLIREFWFRSDVE